MNGNNWKHRTKRHQVELENVVAAKTTKLHGYGMGVTFSGAHFTWKHDFTSMAESLRFSDANFTKG